MDPADNEFEPTHHPWPRPLTWSLGAVFVALLLINGFNLLYTDKAYPGVSVYGTYIGGQGKAAAIKSVTSDLADYQAQAIPVSYGTTSLHLSPAQIGVDFQVEQAVNEALTYGRNGDWKSRLHQQVRSLLGRPTHYSDLTIDDSKLTPLLLIIDQEFGL